MVEINAALVKELREETNAGMMDCKRALVEAKGDKSLAVKFLRERGVAIAGAKSSRAANQGIIASVLLDDGRCGSLIEVNCETDFVAKNESFKTFVNQLAEKTAQAPGDIAESVQQELVSKIAEIGENIVLRRNVRFKCDGEGLVASYIHHGSKIGVLVEVGCQKNETAKNDIFRAMVKDLCLQITAASPGYVDKENVPADVIASEGEIYAKQFEGKPTQIIDKIVTGKLSKFYDQVCLVRQPFIKDQDITIAALIAGNEKELDDKLEVRRFARFQVGENF